MCRPCLCRSGQPPPNLPPKKPTNYDTTCARSTGSRERSMVTQPDKNTKNHNSRTSFKIETCVIGKIDGGLGITNFKWLGGGHAAHPNPKYGSEPLITSFHFWLCLGRRPSENESGLSSD